METGHLAGVRRAELVRIPADGDDDVDPAGQEVVHVLGGMRGDIHASLGHDLDRQGMHIARRLRARAEDLGGIAHGNAQETFGHMAAARITGAKDEDGGFGERHSRTGGLEGRGTGGQDGRGATASRPFSGW